jgi:hypothetical protein
MPASCRRATSWSRASERHRARRPGGRDRSRARRCDSARDEARPCSRERIGTLFRARSFFAMRASAAHGRNFSFPKNGVITPKTRSSRLPKCDFEGMLPRSERWHDKGTPVERPGRKATGPNRTARKESRVTEVVVRTWTSSEGRVANRFCLRLDVACVRGARVARHAQARLGSERTPRCNRRDDTDGTEERAHAGRERRAPPKPGP